MTSAYFLYCEDAYGHVAFSLTAEGAAQFTGTVNVLGDLLVWANAGPPLGSQGATLHPIHNAWETGLDIQDASAVSLLKLESMNADTACPLATFKGRIKHDGTYGIVCANAALPANATGGFLYIPTCAGTPTGTPVAQSGCVALLFDVDNYRLYVYDNGSWRGVTLSA